MKKILCGIILAVISITITSDISVKAGEHTHSEECYTNLHLHGPGCYSDTIILTSEEIAYSNQKIEYVNIPSETSPCYYDSSTGIKYASFCFDCVPTSGDRGFVKSLLRNVLL